MKQILLFVTTVFILVSCKTSKNYLSKADEDRTLFDVVKRLNKKSSDEDAVNALPQVYKTVQQKHLRKISALSNSKELNHWDKLLDEYTTLQNMYEAINNSDAAARLINAASYQTEILDVKQKAADEYYTAAVNLLQNNYRDDIKKAYNYFKKTDRWVPGFKDSRSKMDEAYEKATLDVVINPVQDNSFFFNTGWGNTGYNYSNEYFQQNLIRDLGGKYGTRYPARFYTEWEARRDNVTPEWVVDMVLRNMEMQPPKTQNESHIVSSSVESGRDSSGRPVYKTVTATIYTSIIKYTARCQLDLNITDIQNRKSIAFNSFNDEYSWQEIKSTYSGDYRALGSDELERINTNSNNAQPRKEEILNELYRKIYPQVKNRISYAADW
jgi:cell fate (sporulation/competence/biofilm development) regulator YlbF (YheA/YmcA/DUF963 family)